MAVPEQTPYKEFTANGITKVFPLEFDVLEQDHLIVLVNDLEPTVGSWSLDAENDTVVFALPPANGANIKIRRDTPLSRSTDYESYNNSFRPKPVNDDMDNIWRKLQEMGVINWMIDNNIKDLNEYVDGLNDETKAIFLQMIQEQGTSLEQLDSYVDQLYKNLANVAVDNGWFAEFVADGEENQAQINRLTIRNVESVSKMIELENPNQNQLVLARSFDGDNFYFDQNKKDVNDGFSIFNGWTRQVSYLHISPLWWGADPTGAKDSTEAFKKFSLYLNFLVKNATYPPVCEIPTGTYTINGNIEFIDLSNVTMYCLGAIINGISSENFDSLFKINNAVNTKITGSLTVSCNKLKNYKSAFKLTASSGSILDPNGIVSHCSFMGITAENSVIGYQIGENLDNWDKHVAESHFIGCHTRFTQIACANFGSQTETSFCGSTLASGYLNEDDVNEKYRILLVKGGIVEFIGGSIINSMLPNNFSDSVAIDIQPSKSILYNNPYPVVCISGAHTEITSGLLNISSESEGAYSLFSNISITGCKGWIGQQPAENFINIYDASYAGKVTISSDNNFYGSSARTGQNLVSNSEAVLLNISPMAFGNNFKKGLGSITGGNLKHEYELVGKYYAIDQPILFGGNILKYKFATANEDMTRYNIYDSLTGRITIPFNLSNLTIQAVVSSQSIVDGDFLIKKNGGIVSFGIVQIGKIMSIYYVDVAANAGDFYTIEYTATSPINISSGEPSTLNIFAKV